MKIVHLKKKEKLFLIIGFISIFLIHLITINKFYMIYLSTDEFAQWGIAAYLNGVNWGDTVSLQGYYSYFYAFLLTPIFKLIPDVVVMYRFALILNAFLLSTTIFFSYMICRYLDNTTFTSMCASMCVSLYSANIVQSKFTWTETLLITLFWAAAYLLIKIIKDNLSYRNIIMFAFTLAIGYTVHQRWLGILLSGLLILIVLKRVKKINFKQLICGLIVIISLLLINEIIKKYLIENLWIPHSNSANFQVNDYGGQISKLKNLFTIKGFLNFLGVFSGQLFYIGTATYFTGYIGIYYLIDQFIKQTKQLKITNKVDEKYAFYIFLFFSIILTMGISALFMSTPTRPDHIVYGRYNELFVGITVLIGISEIQNHKYSKKAVYYLISFLVLSLITDIFMKLCTSNPFWTDYFQTVCAIGVGVYLNVGISFVPMLIIVCVLSTLIITLAENAQIWMKLVSTCLICIVFIFTGLTVLKKTAIPFEQSWYTAHELTDYVRGDNIKEAYWYGEYDLLKQPFTQYLLKDIELKNIEFNSKKVHEGDYVFTSENPLNLNGYKLISSQMDVSLLQRVNHDGVEIPLKYFSTLIGAQNDMFCFESQGNAGILMYGPYWKLEPGEYLFSLNLKVSNNKVDDLGWVEFSSTQNGAEITERFPLVKTQFTNSEYNIISFPQDLEAMADRFEIRVYVNENVNLTIDSVYCEKMEVKG